MLNASTEQQQLGSTWRVVNYTHNIIGLESLHDARLDALAKVKTEFCAYVDRDDTLPKNTSEQVLRLTVQMNNFGADLAYTDYMQIVPTGGATVRPGEYSWVKHATNINFIHQLAVMRTSAAQEIAETAPRGLYWTEFLLYVELAKTNPIYFPETCYIYNKKTTGMHAHPDISRAQANSLMWHLQQRQLTRH